MAWRDEMNVLDSDVAAGRITAEEYRTKRDELLASSGSGAATGGPDPFPPPFRWGEQAKGEPQDPGVADRTQVVRHGSTPDPERTQVVRPGSAAPESDHTQVVRQDSDRTQVVRRGAPLTAQEYSPGSPPWQATRNPAGAAPPSRPGGTAPPWNTGFTPQQGSDSFGGFRAEPKRSKWIALAVAVVVAVVVIGAVTFLALRGGESDTARGAAATSSSAADTSGGSDAAPTTKGPETPGRILTGLDGRSDATLSGDTTVTKGAGLTQFSLEEAALLTTCGATAGTVDVLYAASWYTQTHAFSCKSTAAAAAAAAAMLQKQIGYGFLEGSTVGSLRVATLDTANGVPAAPFDERVFYVSGTSVVRVEVRGTTRADADRGLSAVLGAAMDNLPSS